MSIIYRGWRVGQFGKPFVIYKFRTMIEGADKISKFARDDLITPTGRFLRKYRLDEIPQIWNILKGDMAIIGPRPDEPEFIAKIPEKERNIILSVKPGLTDLATLSMLNPKTKEDYIKDILPEKIALQVEYIKTKSLWLDIKILVKTAYRLFRGN